MNTEKKVLNILGLVVVTVVLIGIVYFKYMNDQGKDSVLGTVLYTILLIGSISTLALYYINVKRNNDDEE